MCIVFGDGDAELAQHEPAQFMRAVGSVGDKGDTTDRGRRDGELTAHAITPRPRSGGHPPPLRGAEDEAAVVILYTDDATRRVVGLDSDRVGSTAKSRVAAV
jgi:hypothetical protein